MKNNDRQKYIVDSNDPNFQLQQNNKDRVKSISSDYSKIELPLIQVTKFNFEIKKLRPVRIYGNNILQEEDQIEKQGVIEQIPIITPSVDKQKINLYPAKYSQKFYKQKLTDNQSITEYLNYYEKLHNKLLKFQKSKNNQHINSNNGIKLKLCATERIDRDFSNIKESKILASTRLPSIFLSRSSMRKIPDYFQENQNNQKVQLINSETKYDKNKKNNQNNEEQVIHRLLRKNLFQNSEKKIIKMIKITNRNKTPIKQSNKTKRVSLVLKNSNTNKKLQKERKNKRIYTYKLHAERQTGLQNQEKQKQDCLECLNKQRNSIRFQKHARKTINLSPKLKKDKKQKYTQQSKAQHHTSQINNDQLNKQNRNSVSPFSATSKKRGISIISTPSKSPKSRTNKQVATHWNILPCIKLE